MPARIFCRFGELKGVSAQIGEEDFILGRSRDVTLPLATELVSGKHARIRWDTAEDAYVLEDLGSTNGTELDGVPVRGPERLGHLHVITLAGEHEMIFQDLAATARRHGTDFDESAETVDYDDDTRLDEEPAVLPAGLAPPEDATQVDVAGIRLPAALAPPGAAAPAAAEKKAAVELALVVKLDEGVRHFRLREGENLVGRVEEAGISIDSLEVSRRHAVLKVEAGKVTVRDLGSSNKTYVDGEAVEGETEIGPGSRLGFGGVKGRLVREGDPA